MKDRKLSFPNWLLNSQLLGVDLGSSCAWGRCDSLCRKRFRSCLAPGRLSLSMKMCAQRKAGRRQRVTLPIVPRGSSPVVRLYLGKTEAPEEEAVFRSTARKVALVPFFARPKTKNPVPRSYFAPKPNGNAFYSGDEGMHCSFLCSLLSLRIF